MSFLCVGSSVPSSIQSNQRFITRQRHVVFDGTDNSDVSIVINLHTVEFYQMKDSMIIIRITERLSLTISVNKIEVIAFMSDDIPDASLRVGE